MICKARGCCSEHNASVRREFTDLDCNFSIWEVESQKLKVQGQPGLQ